MAAYTQLDESSFPIVTVRFTGESATDENFQAYLDEVKSVYDRKAALVLIFDARKAVLPGLKQQKIQAQWLKDHDQMMRTYCKGTAYVINHRMIRTVLRAIFSFQAQPVPYIVVGTVEEAADWAKEQLKNEAV